MQNRAVSNKNDCVSILKANDTQQVMSNGNGLTDDKLVDAMGNVYVKHEFNIHQNNGLNGDVDIEAGHDHAHIHFHGNKGNLIIMSLGVVIHCFADGVALGSSCYALQNKENKLPLIIFFALLLHKVPEAIGLTTFLRHEHLPGREILIHLIIFALSAPIGAILTYGIFVMFTVSQGGSGAFTAVGVVLLISAGTFMYVSMIHILPEVYCNSDTHRPHTHKHIPEDHIHDETHFCKEIELLTMIAGLLAPMLLHFI